ncbi:hypothetical protein JCGZ_02106 [Jatropha curcas]|uniref:Peptidase A1 domain-containing protein n=1 Tax=Jatropha curcas TaxID=180498 RepID=A0A067KYQ6_JATCU|nr:probable aspartic proteinase GIP2 [Jatropha curcas]KDP40108.1 hypothetical protein JCGZ_02106 [Jatropha curcas]
MASFQFLLFCSFINFLYLIHAEISFASLQDLVLLPVSKDLATLQYMTQIYHGTSGMPTKLVIDLGGPFLWHDCSSGKVSYEHLIPSCSIQCAMAKKFHTEQKNCFSDTSRSEEQYPSTCDISTRNGITRSRTRGELAEDVIAVRTVDGTKSGKIVEIDNFLFACASTALLDGLAGGAQGMLGLGRTPIALPSQLAAKFDLDKKFAACLSSSNGVILFGNSGSFFGPEILNSLTYTPLLTNPSGESQEYLINVRSIRINGKRLALGQGGFKGGTKISTTVPYTTLESSIYSTFIKAYTKAANSMNLTRVDPEPSSPFGLCFSSKGIANTIMGPMVPAIDLVLQSEMVKWRIHGRNSMVQVSDEMMCLGLLDGGLESENSIVIGGFQLEDTLLEFDLGNSMLGFSFPILMRQTSCSSFLDSMGKDSL